MGLVGLSGQPAPLSGCPTRSCNLLGQAPGLADGSMATLGRSGALAALLTENSPQGTQPGLVEGGRVDNSEALGHCLLCCPVVLGRVLGPLHAMVSPSSV